MAFAKSDRENIDVQIKAGVKMNQHVYLIQSKQSNNLRNTK